tara:strand:+ start:169 stop:615 length:447 start_codon:yes stop_codon:yes gene_type:complete
MNFWEDYYRIEEDGSVYSIKTGRKLKQQLVKKGYFQIDLSINGKRKRKTVHRLVALTYIPNEDNKPQVDHIDRNKQNNHFTNLRWVTNIENMQNLERGKTGELNIVFDRNGKYKIQFSRNKLFYWKYMPIDSTVEQVVIQRDIMLSMF